MRPWDLLDWAERTDLVMGAAEQLLRLGAYAAVIAAAIKWLATS